jgi:hypothetical protein
VETWAIQVVKALKDTQVAVALLGTQAVKAIQATQVAKASWDIPAVWVILVTLVATVLRVPQVRLGHRVIQVVTETLDQLVPQGRRVYRVYKAKLDSLDLRALLVQQGLPAVQGQQASLAALV